MPCRCPKQVWMYFNRQNSATMSPQLPYLQFLFVALLLLQKDITCCFLDINLTYVPGNHSKISKGCNAGSSEGDKVFRPQENWTWGEEALPWWYNCRRGLFRFKCHGNCCLEQTHCLSPWGWCSNPFEHPPFSVPTELNSSYWNHTGGAGARQ